jgi:hypothetical protein
MDSNKDILSYLESFLCHTSLDIVPKKLLPLYYLIKAYQSMHEEDINNTDYKLMLDMRIKERMDLGKERYGHGVRIADDTRQWGTKEDSWMEMCEEEIIDGIIYSIAHHLRTL